MASAKAEEGKASEGRRRTQESGDSILSKFQDEVKKLAHMSSETAAKANTHTHTHTHTQTYFSKVQFFSKVL
jgi:hypothetical protein